MDDDDVIVIIIIMDFKTYTTVLLSVDILMFKRSILHLLGLLVSVFFFLFLHYITSCILFFSLASNVSDQFFCI